ncbi:MAG TPA: glutamate formimidoyltransferase [Candidatus Acidoferrales bacterium]|nr:glutamate formimidoyltransferase [Candidatus Acidoferrales bacterium]
MRTLVECVPNFSEGRDAAKVDSIVAALLSVPGVSLLDREMDADHNRCVITLVGPKEAIGEAALRGVGKAAELIDLTKHQGAHPRLGAADVVPFVPIEGVTIDDCVALARQVGQQVWERFQIPVYLYEAAATRPERENLENIRRGQFEGVREEVLTNPDRAPDFGEPRLHPTAGATVVGARKFLIAYNINLNTPDVKIAKEIAKTIRFSSGGLRYVKAMGVDLKARGLAQVSINLTDFERTPIFRVFEIVKREAARYGAAIVGSEIVGLVPKRALEATADFFLQLENFNPDQQILENRLAAVLSGEITSSGQPVTLGMKAEPLLAAVAAPTPAPGGGSCAALAGALAASLGEMVARLSAKKKALAQHANALLKLGDDFAARRAQLQSAIDRDAASFDAVMAAMRLPKDSDAEKQARDQAIEAATQRATEVPFEVAEAAAAVLDSLAQLAPVSAPAMASDLRTGQHLATAALQGALENVRINLEAIQDQRFQAKAKARAAQLEARLGDAVAVSK